MERHEQRQGKPETPAGAAPATPTTPLTAPDQVLALQRTAGNRAVGRMLQRAAVSTAGGEWDTEDYRAIDSANRIGAHMRLKFTPKDPVVADQIGLTQTVKTTKKTGSGAAQPDYVGPRNQALGLPAGSKDEGRALDQGDGPGMPNTNPLYAVENAPGNVSKALDDRPANPGFGQHGRRKLGPDGKTYEETPGILDDTPQRGKAPDEAWDQKFEVTALPLDGPLKNTYLGSVEWGWKRPAGGAVSLDPPAPRVVREGTPSAAFMEAAQRWNDTKFSEGGTDYETVNLPIEGQDPGALSKQQLTQRLWQARAEADKAAPADKPRKQFQVRALERELAKRK